MGLRSNATKDEIKKAYRKKARILHPDINKAEDAHEKFIEITMAYEFLISDQPYKSKFVYNQDTSAEESESYREWQRAAKEKAERQAKARYEEFKRKNEAFKRTIFYPLIVLVSVLVILVTAAFTLGFFSLPFIALYYNAPWWGILICAIFATPGFFSYRSLKELIRDLKDIMN